MTIEGQRVSSSTRIPVGELVKNNLETIFPGLTSEQAAALREGRPVPPSPAWPAAHEKASGRLLAQMADGIAEHGPSVGCILVVSDPRRLKQLVPHAVRQFLAQHYRHKQLVVVNATGTPFSHDHPDVKVVAVDDEMPLAGLRNLGASQCECECEWVKPCWDDDDVYDPMLLTYMMAHRRGYYPLLLSSQTRVDVLRGTAYVHHEKRGVPNTVLLPNYGHALFDPDCVMRVVVDNIGFPANMLSVAVYHGRNATPVEEFMAGHASDEFRNVLELSEQEARHLKEVLLPFGVKMNQPEPALP
jgi:hypothetical protein